MTTFYIARHGQTENNKNRRFSGWIDTPLTEEGKENAQTSGKKLVNIEFDKLVSSDMGRAIYTAYIISRVIGFNGEIELNKGLREINYGDFANMPYSTYPELSPIENADFIAPNGESLTQAQSRIMDCVKAIGRESLDKTILLVAHDGTMNAIRAEFRGENIGVVDSERLNKHDTVVRFELDNGQITSLEEVI
jgi:broad specificity phosphatase PhoE